MVIGGGQAGLAASHHLADRGIEHAVLERGRVAETWRSERWDAFHLNTPNWAARLPGAPRMGDDPDAFAGRDEVIDHLERYAAGAPVREGVEVTRLRPGGGRFRLETSEGDVGARSVVVASGAFQQPRRPPASPSGVPVLHTSRYRNPASLPDGDVLIVGSGQSGCEIGYELLASGRRVHLSVGRCAWAPRRYRGREVIRWLLDLGLMDQTAESLPSPEARLAGNFAVSGSHGGIDCNPLVLERAGARLHGRLMGYEDGHAVFAADLEDSLRYGMEWEREVCGKMDAYAEAAGLDLPPAPSQQAPVARPDGSESVDLSSIGLVLLANGFRPAYGWIEADVFDDLGLPVTRRGVTALPGLCFVGVPWLYTRQSPLFLGVGADAEHVVDAIAAHLADP